jgi:hypothetical protein
LGPIWSNDEEEIKIAAQEVITKKAILYSRELPEIPYQTMILKEQSLPSFLI